MVNKEKVPEIRFPELTDDWQEKVFGEILVSARLGGNYGNSETENAMPLIKMGNIGRGSIKLDKIEYIDSDEELNDLDKIQENDLFFNTRNTLELVGKVAIWRNELPVAYYNSNLMCIRFENNRFMNYRLNTTECVKSLNRVATGTTSVAAIYNRDLVKIKFHIPSLPEQTKIANFLTAVDAKIANLNEEKSLLENYKKGVMQKIFSRELCFKQEDGSDFPEWETKTFADVAKFINGKAYKQVELLSSGKYKVLRVGNLFSNNEWYYSDLELDEDKYVENGDLMYAWSATFGPHFWKGAKTIYHYHIWKVIPNKSMNKLFLYYVFIDDIERIKSQSQGGTMFHITKGSIEGRKLKVPTLPEQTKIANFLASIDEKINTATEAIEKAQEWKKGLLQQLFV